jgi:hypothetical protein
MKILILLTLAIVLIVSACDNRKDPYLDLDSGPIVQVMKITDGLASTEISDSVKLGQTYTFKYSLESFENISINVEKSRTADSIGMNSNYVNVKGANEGISVYTLKAMDSFGKESQAKVNLTIFLNLKPICSFTVKKVGQLSDYEIEIDASLSYDPDAKWGGHIVQWEYQVQTNYDVKNALSSIHYICDGPGQKKINVRVKDDNGVWSDWKTQYYTLQ